jgi:hypothetical protein
MRRLLADGGNISSSTDARLVVVPIVNPIGWRLNENRAMLLLDVRFVQTDLWVVIDLLRLRATLEAEILVLRQQINVLRRASSKRPPFISIDRLILGGVCRLSQDE